MKASPTDQRRVVDLAVLDDAIAQAERARKNPPHAARMQELMAQRQVQSVELTRLLGEFDDIQAEIARVESDVTVVQARATRDHDLLAASSNVKEAAGLEHELESLAKRRSDLEDAQLELMERADTAQVSVDAQKLLVAATNAEGAELSAQSKAVVAEAVTRGEQATRDRDAVASEIPTDLLAFYTRIASRDTGAALLVARTCEACRMVLSGTEVNTFRQAADDDVLTCPQCGCILVRTDASGLS